MKSSLIFTTIVALVTLVFGDKEEDSPVNYSFEYAVKDPKTGDYKSQKETRDGHVVKGVYILNEPDGSKRIVEYIADHKDGFRAVVKREGEVRHPARNVKTDDIKDTSEGKESHSGNTKQEKQQT